jgi:hypothetical protein
VVGGVLLSCQMRLGWNYRRILGVISRIFHVTRFEARDDSKIRFWSDQWWEDMALKEAFQDLFGISCTKNGFYCNSVF